MRKGPGKRFFKKEKTSTANDAANADRHGRRKPFKRIISLRLKIHQAQAKNFCRVLDIRVSQIVKSQVFQSRILQDFLVDVDH